MAVPLQPEKGDMVDPLWKIKIEKKRKEKKKKKKKKVGKEEEWKLKRLHLSAGFWPSSRGGFNP